MPVTPGAIAIAALNLLNGHNDSAVRRAPSLGVARGLLLAWLACTVKSVVAFAHRARW